VAAVRLGDVSFRYERRGRWVLRGVTGLLLAIVVGVERSPVPWLVPPVTATGRMLAHRPEPVTAVALTVQALAWTAIVIGGYARLRRTRS